MSAPELVGAAISLVILPLVVNELWAWLPRIAERLVVKHASRLPLELSSRYAEEWTSELQQVPGGLAKLLFAADLCRAVPRIQQEFFAPGRAYRPVPRALARLLSILVAMAALIALAPLYAMLWCLLRTQGRPVIERQPRVGLGQKEFMRLRFAADTRTPTGRFLLRTSLDQLPLFWNVLRGDMNLVGPWPCHVGREGPPEHAPRFAVHPGVVGPNLLFDQAEGSPASSTLRDDWYVRNRSLHLDFRIMVRAMVVAFAHRGR